MPRRDTTGSRAAMESVLIAAALLVVVPALGLLLVKWLDVAVPQAVGVGAAVVVGIGLLLVLVAAVATGYRATNDASDHAFGLPDGSVRALLALSLLLAFVALVVYVLGSVLEGDDRSAAAQQVVGTLGTLLAAVAAFYFGANSVKTGAAALASMTGVGQRGPEAITKGTANQDTELVGNVNPHGLETRYFFEYTRTTSADPPTSHAEQTAIGTVPPGDDAVEVRMTLDQQLSTGSWMRIVAFNPQGVATGRNQLVGGP